MSDRTSSASTRPSASVSSTSSAGRGAVWARTISSASSTEITPSFYDGRRSRLRKQAAAAGRLCHPRDREHMGGRAHVQFALPRQVEDLVERALHVALELLRDLELVPDEALQVLGPLEIGRGDAARVAEDVRDHEHPALL